MHNFPSLNMSRGLAKPAFYVTFLEYDSILLQKWQSLLQLPQLNSLWPLQTLSEVLILLTKGGTMEAEW